LKALAGRPEEIERRMRIRGRCCGDAVRDGGMSSAGRLRNGMQVNLPEYSGAALVKVFTGRRSCWDCQADCGDADAADCVLG